MDKILLIEPSATLRHILGKSLREHDFHFTEATTHQMGLETLSQPHDFRGVMLGWSGRTSLITQQILEFLTSPRGKSLPTVFLALEVDQEKLAWVNHRGYSALLQWDQHQDAGAALRKLLTQQPTLLQEPVPARDTDSIQILFVDDSPTVRALTSRLLRRAGYLTNTASSVAGALNLAETTNYDIAIIDYFMPDGNGDEVCRRLRDNPKTAGIMTAIFTGSYLDKAIKDALDAGASECMFKNEADELFLARVAAMSRTIRTRRSIEKEHKRLEGILSSVGDGVYGVDTQAKITFINPAARRILGYTPDSPLLGLSPRELFHYANFEGTPNTPDTCFLQQAYELGDELHGWETCFWDHNGKAIPVECTVYPLRIDQKLEGSVVAFRDISGYKLMEEKLKWQVNHDHLTHLLNRHYFEEELNKEFLRLRRHPEDQSSLFYIDLDRFKYINDTAGHSAGDQLLIEVGKLLSAQLRSSDMLARLGGDEFAVIARCVPTDKILALAEQFRLALNRFTFSYQGKQYKVDGSIGAAVINHTIKTAEEALANADIACHIAKEKGRNQTHLFRIENDRRMVMDLDLGWSARLRDALEKDNLILYFQPILPLSALNLPQLPIPLAQGLLGPNNTFPIAPSHYEVLVRLRGRDGGVVHPNAFLPTAERFGLMYEIDCWVIEHALKRLARHQHKGCRPGLSLNLSGQTLADKNLSGYIQHLMTRYAIDPNSLIFELTETSAIANIDGAKRLIKELGSLGCKFALDDFGCGFSSFSHLKHLQVNYIKIDGMFVQGMVNDPIDQAMVRSMNDIAHSLGKQTIAEYVESLDQLSLLQHYGTDLVQGYYLGRPSDHYLG